MNLFDTIHDSTLYVDRDFPASAEEFIGFGLNLEDYIHYIALQYRLQSELLMDDFSKTTITAEEDLISFCIEKSIVNPQIYDYKYSVRFFNRSDAEYYYDWLRYPIEPEKFRLNIERKLSRFWNPVSIYLSQHFDGVSFTYDDILCNDRNESLIAYDNPIRVVKYDPSINQLVILSTNEVKKMLKQALKEKAMIDKEVTAHLSAVPSKENSSTTKQGLPWIQQLYKLTNKQNDIEEICESLDSAAKAHDIVSIKEDDVLYVFCDKDICKEQGHLISYVTVQFSFYGKPDKYLRIERCAHCKRYQMILNDLIELHKSYGVPKVIIIYDKNDGSDFSDFNEKSILYEMGYTVSQSVGLSAERRQKILKLAIDSGKVSKQWVITFLRQRMNINGMKSGNKIAFKKWKEDYDYIMTLL